ncbi:hypothetical protein H4219_002680 [Mycoemilia scoparia]|uniref:Metallo-beta-lactamase domain-containing protein n=1 Tax=Mycoemilia scoparia TaxID=417184 RepID=A0A9W8A3C4_9FUNG|nr:hypothetical protein H4219_002680 [Mycoemilia scoparia]
MESGFFTVLDVKPPNRPSIPTMPGDIIAFNSFPDDLSSTTPTSPPLSPTLSIDSDSSSLVSSIYNTPTLHYATPLDSPISISPFNIDHFPTKEHASSGGSILQPPSLSEMSMSLQTNNYNHHHHNQMFPRKSQNSGSRCLHTMVSHPALLQWALSEDHELRNLELRRDARKYRERSRSHLASYTHNCPSVLPNNMSQSLTTQASAPAICAECANHRNDDHRRKPSLVRKRALTSYPSLPNSLLSKGAKNYGNSPIHSRKTSTASNLSFVSNFSTISSGSDDSFYSADDSISEPVSPTSGAHETDSSYTCKSDRGLLGDLGTFHSENEAEYNNYDDENGGFGGSGSSSYSLSGATNSVGEISTPASSEISIGPTMIRPTDISRGGRLPRNLRPSSWFHLIVRFQDAPSVRDPDSIINDADFYTVPPYTAREPAAGESSCNVDCSRWKCKGLGLGGNVSNNGGSDFNHPEFQHTKRRASCFDPFFQGFSEKTEDTDLHNAPSDPDSCTLGNDNASLLATTNTDIQNTSYQKPKHASDTRAEYSTTNDCWLQPLRRDERVPDDQNQPLENRDCSRDCDILVYHQQHQKIYSDESVNSSKDARSEAPSTLTKNVKNLLLQNQKHFNNAQVDQSQQVLTAKENRVNKKNPALSSCLCEQQQGAATTGVPCENGEGRVSVIAQQCNVCKKTFPSMSNADGQLVTADNVTHAVASRRQSVRPGNSVVASRRGTETTCSSVFISPEIKPSRSHRPSIAEHLAPSVPQSPTSLTPSGHRLSNASSIGSGASTDSQCGVLGRRRSFPAIAGRLSLSTSGENCTSVDSKESQQQQKQQQQQPKSYASSPLAPPSVSFAADAKQDGAESIRTSEREGHKCNCLSRKGKRAELCTHKQTSSAGAKSPEPRNIRSSSLISSSPSGRSVPILEQALRARHPIYKLGTLANDTFEAGKYLDAFELYSWALLFLYPRKGTAAADYLSDSVTRKRLKQLGWRLEKKDLELLGRRPNATRQSGSEFGPNYSKSRDPRNSEAKQSTSLEEGSANSSEAELTSSARNDKTESTTCNPLRSFFKSRSKQQKTKSKEKGLKSHSHQPSPTDSPILPKPSRPEQSDSNLSAPVEPTNRRHDANFTAGQFSLSDDDDQIYKKGNRGSNCLKFWSFPGLADGNGKNRADPIALGGEDPIGDSKRNRFSNDNVCDDDVDTSPDAILSYPGSPVTMSSAGQGDHDVLPLLSQRTNSGKGSPVMEDGRVFPADVDNNDLKNARGPSGYTIPLKEGDSPSNVAAALESKNTSSHSLPDHISGETGSSYVDPWAMKNPEEKDEVTALLYANRSATAYALERYGEAVRDANRCIELRPKWAKGYFRKAEAFLALGKAHNAYIFYKKAIVRDPSDTTIKLGYERARLTTKNEAMGLKVIQILPGRDICHKAPGIHVIRNFIFMYAGEMANYIYLIADMDTRKCIIVDACWDVPGIIKIIEREGLQLAGAIVTHAHFDHVGGIPPPPFSSLHIKVTGLATLKKIYPYLSLMAHPLDIPSILEANPSLSKNQITPTPNGFEFILGKRTKIQTIHTPGHTPGSQCILVNGSRLFSGDTLFPGNCGRVDLEGGDLRDMIQSLQTRLQVLGDSTVVYPGHEYGGEWTTIGREKKHGFLRPVTGDTAEELWEQLDMHCDNPKEPKTEISQ